MGLVNTLDRLRMLYGPDCQVLYTNRGGARVEWIIPLTEGNTQERGETDDHEAADC